MIAIPAIDLIDGRCVRLVEGRYDRVTFYDLDPVDWARRIEEAGFSRLHIVDLDGARTGSLSNLKTLEAVAQQTSLRVDFGGGVRTAEGVEQVLDAGADMATVGSAAVKDPEEFDRWVRRFGAGRFVIAADARDGKVATHGWQEYSDLDVGTFIADNVRRGVTDFICTDIARDGKMTGPATALYQDLAESITGACIIASGGVRSLDDMRELDDAGVCATIVGKALYEEAMTLEELSKWAGRER